MNNLLIHLLLSDLIGPFMIQVYNSLPSTVCVRILTFPRAVFFSLCNSAISFIMASALLSCNCLISFLIFSMSSNVYFWFPLPDGEGDREEGEGERERGDRGEGGGCSWLTSMAILDSMEGRDGSSCTEGGAARELLSCFPASLPSFDLCMTWQLILKSKY